MNNKDKIEHIMALHNGELGVTWEDPDVVTPDTIAKLDQLIQDERKEAVEEALKAFYEVMMENETNEDAIRLVEYRLARLTKGGNTGE